MDRQGKTAYFIRAFAYYAQFSLHFLRLQILHKRIKTRGLVTMIVVDSTHFMINEDTRTILLERRHRTCAFVCAWGVGLTAYRYITPVSASSF